MNKESWDFKYGNPFTEQTKQQILKDLANPYVVGLSILGGDPLEPENIPVVEDLCKAVREKFGNTRNICLWTGRKKEKVIDLPIMQYLDVVVSDPYIEKFNTGKTKYRGSSNQRVWWAKTGEPYTDEALEDEHHANDFKEFDVEGNRICEITQSKGCGCDN